MFFIQNTYKKIFIFSVIIYIFSINSLLAKKSNDTNEYIFSIPPVYEEKIKENFVTLYIITLEATNISVEVPGQYMNKKKAGAKETLIFQIDASFGQVASWNKDINSQAPVLSNIYKDRAIRVISDKPVLCYVLCQY